MKNDTGSLGSSPILVRFSASHDSKQAGAAHLPVKRLEGLGQLDMGNLAGGAHDSVRHGFNRNDPNPAFVWWEAREFVSSCKGLGYAPVR